MTRRPVILLPACHPQGSGYPFFTVGQPYIEAVALAGGQPLVVPVADPASVDELLSLADGVLLTGSPSNVHPSHFGEAVLDPSLPLDPKRDAWTLPLARRALQRGVPLLAICRGAQEVNVALGGSLHQAVQDVGPFADHRPRDEDPLELKFADVHDLHIAAGGRLRALLGQETIRVNSLHGQAVDRLADGLQVEARAPDGLIEAFSLPSPAAFNLSVQWHPEWGAGDNPWSRRIFDAFGSACAATRDSRSRSST